jgi:hypothetical protein
MEECWQGSGYRDIGIGKRRLTVSMKAIEVYQPIFRRKR